MNGGNGRGWTDVIKCNKQCRKNNLQESKLMNLPIEQGSTTTDRFAQQMTTGNDIQPSSDIYGRYIFYVTHDVIVRGGCLPIDTKCKLDFLFNKGDVDARLVSLYIAESKKKWLLIFRIKVGTMSRSLL